MKKYIVSFIYLIPFWVLAQDLKPFLQSPYQEFISDIIPLENDEILVTNFITAIDLSTYNYLNNDSINGGFFSTLQVYDKNGLFIKALALPDTDTSVFWSASVIQTQDGKFCIAGQSLNTIANTSKLFFAIINADLNSIESLHILPSTNNVECNIIYEFENGNIAFLANEGGIYKIKQYQKNGTFVSEYNLDNLGCLSVNLKNLSYFHNNEIKQVCSNNISGSFISISENYLIGNYPINVIPEMNNKRVKNFSRRGTIYKNTLLFNAGAVQNPINQNDSIYPLIMQVDTNNNISVFFSDTTSSIHYNSFLYHNNVNIFDEDYIYAVFSDNRQESGAYTLYCLNAQGDIRWKKYINSSVGSLWNIDKKNILQTIATADKGFMFTVLGDDNFGNSDVYYYKLDSLGNQTDFETGIFSLAPKLNINDFALFPNPVKEQIIIETSLKGNFKLTIFDNLGKQIMQNDFLDEATIPLVNLNKGIYFYSIINKEEKLLQEGKFVKE